MCYLLAEYTIYKQAPSDILHRRLLSIALLARNTFVKPFRVFKCLKVLVKGVYWIHIWKIFKNGL